MKLKKDISEHFTLNGKEISREKEMANTISVKDGKYVLAIKGYTNIQFSYQIEKQIDGKTFISLTKSEGNVSKGLLKYNIKEQIVDVASKDKIDITTELNQDKTKESINDQLKDNNKDGDKTPDYKVSAVTEKKLTLDYTRNNTEKEKKPVTESFELNLDENKNIIPDSQGNGKFSQWQEIKGKKANTEYLLDNKYQLPKAEILTRYAQNNSEGKLIIINNIQKFEGDGSIKSIYPEHTEMTDVITNAIKEDFLTNKIERTFTGILNNRHQEDFTNNRKINKAKTGYELQLSFVANNGKINSIALPFTANTANNAERTYAFTNKQLTTNIDGIVYDITVTNTNNIPNIKMQENIKETLSQAEKNTKITLESDIFSGKKEKRINNGNTYNIENLPLSQ